MELTREAAQTAYLNKVTPYDVWKLRREHEKALAEVPGGATAHVARPKQKRDVVESDKYPQAS